MLELKILNTFFLNQTGLSNFKYSKSDVIIMWMACASYFWKNKVNSLNYYIPSLVFQNFGTVNVYFILFLYKIFIMLAPIVCTVADHTTFKPNTVESLILKDCWISQVCWDITSCIFLYIQKEVWLNYQNLKIRGWC